MSEDQLEFLVFQAEGITIGGCKTFRLYMYEMIKYTERHQLTNLCYYALKKNKV